MEELRDFRNKSQSIHEKKKRERMREKERRERGKERKIFHKNNRYWFISVLDIVG